MFETISVNEVQLKIGSWSKRMRKTQNLSQAQLANQLGLSRITIQKLENGKNATMDTLLKVINHFDKLSVLNQYLEADLNENIPKSLY